MLAIPAVAVALILAVNGGLAATDPPPAREVTVCLTAAPPDRAMFEARALATKIFADIGVRIRWTGEGDSCPFTGVRMRFWMRTPEALSPGAFGRSFPAEGTRVDVFYDRINAAAPGARLPSVLGHVLAHELGHVVQAVGRHSAEGVMKAHWKPHDLEGMVWRALSFSDADVELIYTGLVTRTERLRSRTAGGSQY